MPFLFSSLPNLYPFLPAAHADGFARGFVRSACPPLSRRLAIATDRARITAKRLRFMTRRTMPPSSFLVRLALESELDALIECDRYAQSHASRVQELRSALETRSCLIAHASSEPVGFVVLHYGFFGNGFIPLVCVAQHHRGQGAGLQLLLAAQQRCRTNKLFTSTNSSNLAAQRLFAKAGFSPSGSIENLDAGDPELVYFKRLTE